MICNRASQLLRPAIEYACECVSHVTQESLQHRTPCTEWNLAELLCHVNESLAVLHEGTALGFIATGPLARPGDVSADSLVKTFTDRTRDFLAGATPPSGDTGLVTIADRVLPHDLLVAVGVLETVVHGWDIASACNVDKPIPEPLALGIMEVLPVLVTDQARGDDFGPPIRVPRQAASSDRLLAFLGRRSNSRQYVD